MRRGNNGSLQAHSTKRQFRRMTVINVALLTLMILAACFIYTRIVLKRTDQYVNRIIDQYHASVAVRCDEFLRFLQAVAYDSAVTEYFTETDPYTRYQASLKVNALLSNMRMVQSDIRDVFLFFPADEDSTFASIAPVQPEILKSVWSSSQPVILGAYLYADSSGESQVLTAGCFIYDLSKTGASRSKIGAIAATLNLDGLDGVLEELAALDGISYQVMDCRGQVLAGALADPDAGLLSQAMRLKADAPENAYSTVRQSIISVPIEALNGRLLICINRMVLLKDLFQVTGLVSILALVLIVLVNLLYRNIRRQITAPIEGIMRAVEQIGKDGGERRVPVAGNSDLRALSSKLNQMLESEARLTKNLLAAQTRIYETELIASRLELQFLRSQINPHFLYNTLETIRSIAIVRKVPEAALAARSLAKMLRYSIKGGETVPLKEELSIVDCYLAIQNLRFRGRIAGEIEATPEAEAWPIPRMCLQPLVENAVTHGLETLLKEGLLKVICRVEKQMLRIMVIDNGVGMTEEQVRNLNASIRRINPAAPSRPDSGQANIGILNVARRIAMASSGHAAITLASQLGQGTTVELLLPKTPSSEPLREGA